MTKVKVFPLQNKKAHGGCGCKDLHFHSQSIRKREGGLPYA